MFNLLARYWGLILLRGVVALLLAMLMFALPLIAFETLASVLSAVLLLDGFIVLWAALHQQTTEGWRTHLLEGVAGLVFGLLLLMIPQVTLSLLITLLAGWAAITGIIRIWSALHMRQDVEGEFWLGLSGVFAVAFGVILLLFPWLMIAPQMAVNAIGAYSLIAGTILCILSLSLRQQLQDLKHRLTHLTLN